MGSVWIKRCDRCDAPFISPGSGWTLNADKEWIHACDDGYAGGVEEVPVGTPKNDRIQAAKDRIVTDEDAFCEAGTFSSELSCSNASSEPAGVRVKPHKDPVGSISYIVSIRDVGGEYVPAHPFHPFTVREKALEFARIASRMRVADPKRPSWGISGDAYEEWGEANEAAAAPEIPTFKYAKVEANILAGLADADKEWAVRVDGHPPAMQLVATKKEAIRLASIASRQCEVMGSQRAAGHTILKEARKIARLRDENEKELIKKRILEEHAGRQEKFAHEMQKEAFVSMLPACIPPALQRIMLRNKAT